MTLAFSQFCDLLSALEAVVTRDPPLLPAQREQRSIRILQTWFQSHKINVTGGTVDVVVLLSSLFPARRTDRVYNIQHASLVRSLKRCLQLGLTRQKALDDWQKPGRGDLGSAVQRVLCEAEFPALAACRCLTLHQIDAALGVIATTSKFSSREVKDAQTDPCLLQEAATVSKTLAEIYTKLQSRDAKWFTRMILKDYFMVNVEVYSSFVYACIHPHLGLAMRMYDNFSAAVYELRSPDTVRVGTSDTHMQSLMPKVGTKVGSPTWVKARGGIQHVISLAGDRVMSVERKYDGEYCQVHINLTISSGESQIQIFSKSGKNSTDDRRGVLDSIREGLRIGKPDCRISQQCILEGELVVWTDRGQEVLEFHKIRKHIPRSGAYLGIKEDSPPYEDEHLMLVMYDLLLLDSQPVLHLPYRIRREKLCSIADLVEGRLQITQTMGDIAFSSSTAPDRLSEYLAIAFAERWEGLVLKPVEESYFGLGSRINGAACRWIKIKKDCIRGVGDTADFAVIGAGHDAKRAAHFGLSKLRWTHFFLGCLTNRHAVVHFGARPDFLVVDCVTDCIKREDFLTVNQLGKFVELAMDGPSAQKAFDISMVAMSQKTPQMTTVFRQPFVFEIAGSGFDKAANRSMFTLRFPRVSKVRWDRDWREAIDANQLQEMAANARTLPPGDLTEDIAAWKAKISVADSKQTPRRWQDVTTSDEDPGISLDKGPSSPDHHGDQASAAASKSVCATRFDRRRSSGLTAAPLIRVDSAELQENELRLSRSGNNGSARMDIDISSAVVSRKTANPSEGYAPACINAHFPDHLPVKKRKISQDDDEAYPKRRDVHALQEIKNLARPTWAARLPTPPRYGAMVVSRPSDTAFVKTMLVETEDEHRVIRRRYRPEDLPSSPEKQTTEEGYSTGRRSNGSTTQSLSPEKRRQVRAEPMQISTGQSVRKDTQKSGSSWQSKPQHHGAIATPSIHLHREEFCSNPHGTQLTNPSSLNLLINPKDLVRTTQQILSFAQQSRRYSEITVWDRRIRPYLSPSDRRGRTEQELAKKNYFYARISYDRGDHVHEGDRSMRTRIEWRHGVVDVLKTEHHS